MPSCLSLVPATAANFSGIGISRDDCVQSGSSFIGKDDDGDNDGDDDGGGDDDGDGDDGDDCNGDDSLSLSFLVTRSFPGCNFGAGVFARR